MKKAIVWILVIFFVVSASLKIFVKGKNSEQTQATQQNQVVKNDFKDDKDDQVNYSTNFSKNRQNFINNFNEACLTNPNSNVPNGDIVCICMSEFVASKFSDREIDIMTKISNPILEAQSPQEMNEALAVMEKFSQIDSIIQRDVNGLVDYFYKCGKSRGLYELDKNKVEAYIKSMIR